MSEKQMIKQELAEVEMLIHTLTERSYRLREKLGEVSTSPTPEAARIDDLEHKIIMQRRRKALNH